MEENFYFLFFFNLKFLLAIYNWLIKIGRRFNEIFLTRKITDKNEAERFRKISIPIKIFLHARVSN